jgi:hypothetical protein
MAATHDGRDDRAFGLGLVFGLLAVGASGYTLLASFRSATASSDAVAANLQVEAAIGFAAAVTFGCLVVTVLHRYS